MLASTVISFLIDAFEQHPVKLVDHAEIGGLDRCDIFLAGVPTSRVVSD